jgi:3',5'-cyclic-AMP phosphodiesterase
MPPTAPLHIVQLTDTHLFAEPQGEMLGVRTFQTLKSVIECVSAYTPRPDLLLLTGDLSQDETEASYQQLQQLIKPLSIPIYRIPGNHDRPLLIEQVLSDAPFSSLTYFQAGGWNFILLNTAAAGFVHGVLSAQTLQDLEAQLSAAGEGPTLIALHHPPIPIGSAWMDRIGLQNPEPFHAIIQRHPAVKVVLFGHIHQAFAAFQRGVQFLGSPSTCVQFLPNSETMVIDSKTPGFRWLTLYPDGSFDTQIKRVD